MLNRLYHCAKILEEEKEWNKLPEKEREIVLNALSSSQKWNEYMEIKNVNLDSPSIPTSLPSDCLAVRNKEIKHSDILNFRVRSILSNQLINWTLLGPLTGIPEIDSKRSQICNEFELLDEEQNNMNVENNMQDLGKIRAGQANRSLSFQQRSILNKTNDVDKFRQLCNQPTNQNVYPKTVERLITNYNSQAKSLESLALLNIQPATKPTRPKKDSSLKIEDIEEPEPPKNLEAPQTLLDSPIDNVLSHLNCDDFSKNMMMKAIGILLVRQGFDILESEQLMEVITELTIKFIIFFGKMIRKELDIPGRVGTEQAIAKSSIFTCLDSCLGNGIYDVVAYALDSGSPSLNQWSTQFQHLIPFRAIKNSFTKNQNILSLDLDEELPPRQWAVYSNHVPFAKTNLQAIKTQPLYYENIDGHQTNNT